MNRNMRHLFGTCPPNTGGVAQLRSRSAVNKGQIAASRSSNRNDATGIRDTTKSATATLDKVRRHVLCKWLSSPEQSPFCRSWPSRRATSPARRPCARRCAPRPPPRARCRRSSPRCFAWASTRRLSPPLHRLTARLALRTRRSRSACSRRGMRVRSRCAARPL